MRNNKKRFALIREGLQTPRNFPHMFEIKPAGWFVKHNDLPVTHNGRCDRYPLFLPAGKRKRVPVFIFQQIKLFKDFICNSFILVVHAQKHFIHHAFGK